MANSEKPLDVLVKCSLPCSHKVTKLNLDYYIDKNHSTSQLECMYWSQADQDSPAVTDTKDNILEKLLSVFDGLGLLPGEHSLKVDPTVTPVVHPPRRVPFAPRYLIQKELNWMKSQGLFQRPHNPVNW